MAKEIRAACARERDVARQAVKLARFAISNRGCVCNAPGHRCGTNQMLADMAKIEEQIS